MEKKSWWKIALRNDMTVISALSMVKLVLHFLLNGGYGYFRDELYYIACGKHLAFGYVDHPPLVALIAKLSHALMGDSLFALRFFPALAGALVVFLTGLIVKQLGGKRFAQVLGCAAVILSPLFLYTGNVLSMNVFDHLFWALSILIVIRILKYENTKLWLILGIILGIGLMNKHSVFFLGFGLFVGLILTRSRKYLFSINLWLGAAFAFIIFLPHLIWQFIHAFPTVEFIRNASLYKNMMLSPKMFLLVQMVEMHPFLFPILVLGLCYFFLFRAAQPFRLFGWMYLAIFVLFLLTRAKTYYIAPLYPVMFAGGAVAFEVIINRWRLKWLKPATLAFLFGGCLLTAPFVLPFLPVDTFIKYSEFLKFSPPKAEDHEMGRLPQHFADMFGWEPMVRAVNDVYQSLSPEDQAKCGVFAQNYGEAGAMDFFGRTYGLPRAISGHNNYWLWGPGQYTGEIMIVIGGDKAQLEKYFVRVEQAGIFINEYVMPYENNLPLFVCRGLKIPIEDLWPQVKHYE
ncbi:MAG: glycosyltransferase family 39 protein [Candidatus Aminicenantes bacterium]|nr:glycosyltransferase family 39 protein [Candidatus Aminicenantes bacterium]